MTRMETTHPSHANLTSQAQSAKSGRILLCASSIKGGDVYSPENAFL